MICNVVLKVLLFKAPLNAVTRRQMAPKGNVKFIDWIVNNYNETWSLLKLRYDRFIAYIIDVMTYSVRYLRQGNLETRCIYAHGKLPLITIP